MYFCNMCSLRDATPDSFIPPAQNLTLKHLSSIVVVDKLSSSSSVEVSRRREVEDNTEVVTASGIGEEDVEEVVEEESETHSHFVAGS